MEVAITGTDIAVENVVVVHLAHRSHELAHYLDLLVLTPRPTRQLTILCNVEEIRLDSLEQHKQNLLVGVHTVHKCIF